MFMRRVSFCGSVFIFHCCIADDFFGNNILLESALESVSSWVVLERRAMKCCISPSRPKVTSVRTTSNETTPKKSRNPDVPARLLLRKRSTLGNEFPKLSIRRVHAEHRQWVCAQSGRGNQLRLYETLK